jgi:hypothetical protein
VNITQIKLLKRNLCKLLGHEYKTRPSPLPIFNQYADSITVGHCVRCFKRMKFKMDWFNDGDIPRYDNDCFPKEPL